MTTTINIDTTAHNKHLIITNNTLITCKNCGKTFPSNITFNKHECLQSVFRLHQCNYCTKRFRVKSTRLAHEYLHEHPFPCKVCGKRFVTRYACLNHERLHNGKELLHKCNYCDETFKYIANLREHELKVHQKHMHVYKCGFCDKSFSMLKFKKDHEKTHSGQRAFKCRFCARRFSTSNNCIKHERIHKEIKQYQCNKCEKMSEDYREIIEHQRETHLIKSLEQSVDWPFSCRLCQDGFPSNELLIEHEAIHNAIRPYLCGYCTKSFMTRISCSDHERTHFSDRSFHCSFCEKSFADLETCERHELSHIASQKGGEESDQFDQAEPQIANRPDNEKRIFYHIKNRIKGNDQKLQESEPSRKRGRKKFNTLTKHDSDSSCQSQQSNERPKRGVEKSNDLTSAGNVLTFNDSFKKSIGLIENSDVDFGEDTNSELDNDVNIEFVRENFNCHLEGNENLCETNHKNDEYVYTNIEFIRNNYNCLESANVKDEPNKNDEQRANAFERYIMNIELPQIDNEIHEVNNESLNVNNESLKASLKVNNETLKVNSKSQNNDLNRTNNNKQSILDASFKCSFKGCSRTFIQFNNCKRHERIVHKADIKNNTPILGSCLEAMNLQAIENDVNLNIRDIKVELFDDYSNFDSNSIGSSIETEGIDEIKIEHVSIKQEVDSS